MKNKFLPRRPESRSLLEAISLLNITLLIAANVMASKILSFDLPVFGRLMIDAGTLTYPLTFMLGDLLAEFFGYRAARRVILQGFAANLVFSLAAYIGALVPAPTGAGADADTLARAYNSLFLYNPRILAASFTGYVCGNLLNAWSLTAIRRLTGPRFLAVRTIGSTFLGAAADTTLFTTLAWAGVIPAGSMLTMGLSGYLVKMLYEACIATPLDYALKPWLAKRVAPPVKTPV
jgi:uncharacterized integral membrane protein (TIGR00697 family)